MSIARLKLIVLAGAAIALPAVALAEDGPTITESTALCAAAPELPSCAPPAPDADTGDDGVQAPAGGQRKMSLVKSPGAGASTATRSNLVTPAAGGSRGGPRLVSVPAGRPAAATRSGNARMTLAKPPLTDMVVAFRVGSAELTGDAQANLKVYARALKRPEVLDRSYVIGGHTDATGSAAKNLDLSQRRAESVVNALVAEGIAPNRLTARGFGASKLRYGPRDERNRRVELVRAK